jgi:hypothetical protein
MSSNQETALILATDAILLRAYVIKKHNKSHDDDGGALNWINKGPVWNYFEI